MPLNLYPNVHASGAVPTGWVPLRGGTIKYSVNNPKVLSQLRTLRTGTWRKVIKHGAPGAIHFFEHVSGHVADVKYFP